MRPIRVTAAATLAVASLLPLATGAEAAVAAAGTATSTATLASISAVGTDVAVAALTASAGTTSGILSKVTLAPLAVDGVNVVPAVTVEPSNSPVTVPGPSTPDEIGSVLDVMGPTVTISAAGGGSPTSGLTTTDGLGSISVLGMDVSIDGALTVGSTVTPSKADAAKTLTVTDFALPSLADILGSLGIDLAALPVDVLNDLVDQLPISVPTELDAAIVAANAAIDTAQTAVDDAVGDLEVAQSALNTAQSAKNAADAAAAAAQTAFDAALAAIPMDQATWDALGEVAQQATHPTVNALEADLTAKEQAATDAATALATAQGVLDTAQAALNSALAALQPLVDNLAGLVDEALAVPLASLASAQVGSLARVDAAKTAKITGMVSGLKVLDLDVLDMVTGNTTLDLAGAVTAAIAEVNSMAQGVMNDLSSILAGATGMVVPAPQVKILQQTTKTGVNGAFGTADAAVTVLSITMEPITLPEEFAIPFDGELPVNIEEIANGVLQATGFDVTVGTLSEAATYRPAVLNPTGPQLPATGAPYGISLLAATVLGVGVLTRRRLTLARVEE